MSTLRFSSRFDGRTLHLDASVESIEDVDQLAAILFLGGEMLEICKTGVGDPPKRGFISRAGGFDQPSMSTVV